MITARAVEAAAEADYGHGWLGATEAERAAYLDHATLLLEAAAPHLMAEAWDACVDESEALGWMHDVGARDNKARNPYRTTK